MLTGQDFSGILDLATGRKGGEVKSLVQQNWGPVFTLRSRVYRTKKGPEAAIKRHKGRPASRSALAEIHCVPA